MKLFSSFLIFCILQLGLHAQTSKKSQKQDTDTFLTNLLNQYPDYFKALMDKKDSLNIQVIYTRIDRNKFGEPSFK
jgi:hypothetical protein